MYSHHLCPTTHLLLQVPGSHPAGSVPALYPRVCGQVSGPWKVLVGWEWGAKQAGNTGREYGQHWACHGGGLPHTGAFPSCCSHLSTHSCPMCPITPRPPHRYLLSQRVVKPSLAITAVSTALTPLFAAYFVVQQGLGLEGAGYAYCAVQVGGGTWLGLST